MSILDNYYGEGKSIREKITGLEEENKKLKAEIEIRKLTAKDYAKQCGVELNDNLDDIIKKDE